MSTPASALPADLTTRALVPSDATDVFELMAAVQMVDLGSVEIEEADIISDWSRPSYDLAASSVGVFEGETLVGYAEMTYPERYDAAVLPSHNGRGIGTWLAAWARELASGRGHEIVGMPVPEGSLGDRMLTSLGYHVRWNSWVLQVPPGAEVPARELPTGYAVGEARTDELEALHDVLEDAFLEWSKREREPWADFEASVLRRPGFEPWQLRVVREPSGTVVGAAITMLAGDVAYVDRLGVRREERNRGLAQVLLVDAFAMGRAHGASACELNTDSRTGALGLYEKVGMQVTSNWVHRAVHL